MQFWQAILPFCRVLVFWASWDASALTCRPILVQSTCKDTPVASGSSSISSSIDFARIPSRVLLLPNGRICTAAGLERKNMFVDGKICKETAMKEFDLEAGLVREKR